MSRSRSSQSVSLFPFLAVLVCAMGSLIFLLIVTTRQIRTEAVAKRREKEALEDRKQLEVVKPSLAIGLAPSLATHEPVIRTPEPTAEPERIEPLPGAVQLGPALSQPVLPAKEPAPPPEVIPPAAIAQKPAPTDPNLALREKLAELEQKRKAWRQAVQNKKQAVAKRQQQVDSLMESLRRINSQIEEAVRNKNAVRDAQKELIESRNSILGQLAKVEKELEQARQQISAAPTKFQVVPFDGLTGTNYRPILIECTSEGMRFLPEDVVITEADFEGFTQGKNPLLAGAEALSDYWSRVSVRSDGQEPLPYVLLIVRPSGAKYYAARQLLENLDRPFGYELVEENLPLELPPKDPVAAELCRTAVEETLKEREDLKQFLASRRPEMLSGNSNYRVIRKPGGGFEVEYSPDGTFRDDELGGRRSPFDSIGDGPFGRSRFSEPEKPETPGGLGGAGEPGRPRSPLVSPLPGPGGKGNLGSRSPGDPSPTGFPREETATEPGGGPGDPQAPRLLPEDIRRRSQGNVPYEEGIAGSDRIRSTGDGPAQEPGVPVGEPGREGPPGSDSMADDRGAREPSGEPGSKNSLGEIGDRPRPTNVTPLDSQGSSANPAIVTAPPPTSQDSSGVGTQQSTGKTPPAGTPGFGSGSPTDPGIPPSLYEPAMPNFSILNSRRMQDGARPHQRRWGLSSPRASIGFEREIAVRIEPDRLVVGDAFAVNYDARTTKEQLGVGLLEAIELTARKWGRPPMSFYWVPTIRFQLGQEQIPTYHHLNATARAWGLETSAESIE